MLLGLLYGNDAYKILSPGPQYIAQRHHYSQMVNEISRLYSFFTECSGPNLLVCNENDSSKGNLTGSSAEMYSLLTIGCGST